MLLTCHREWFVTIKLLNERHWASCLQCLLQFAHKQLLSMYIHTFLKNSIIFLKSIISGPVGPEHNK